MSIWSKLFGGSEAPPKPDTPPAGAGGGAPSQAVDDAGDVTATLHDSPRDEERVAVPAAPAPAPSPTATADMGAPELPTSFTGKDAKIQGRRTLRGDIDLPGKPQESPKNGAGAAPASRKNHPRKASKTMAMGAMAKPSPSPARPRKPRPAPQPVPKAVPKPAINTQAAVDLEPKTEPHPMPPVAPTGEKGLADTLDSEVDAVFAAATAGVGGAPALATEEPSKELHAMFETMVAMHLRPLRDLMLEVRWGTAPAAWIGHCRIALGTVQNAAAELDRPDLKKHLDTMAKVLETAAKDGRAEIGESHKQPLLNAYEPIAALAPETLSLEDEHGRREPIMVRSLLLQAQDVEHVTLGKLFGAGLSTMQGLLGANAEDVAATANVPDHISSRIVGQVERYKDTYGKTTTALDHATEATHLSAAVTALRDTHAQWEDAASQWSEDARRKKHALQKSRLQLLHRIAVILARMGETDLLRELERKPVGQRIEKLQEVVQKAATAAPSQGAR